MIENMNHGGRIAMLGLPSQPIALDWAKVVSHMITVKGIYGREMYDTWYAMSAMLQTPSSSAAALRDAVRSVITHRFPAVRFAEAFETVRAGECGKVILDWES
jgi:threonine 3-dehydrogenase